MARKQIERLKVDKTFVVPHTCNQAHELSYPLFMQPLTISREEDFWDANYFFCLASVHSTLAKVTWNLPSLLTPKKTHRHQTPVEVSWTSFDITTQDVLGTKSVRFHKTKHSVKGKQTVDRFLPESERRADGPCKMRLTRAACGS